MQKKEVLKTLKERDELTCLNWVWHIKLIQLIVIEHLKKGIGKMREKK